MDFCSYPPRLTTVLGLWLCTIQLPFYCTFPIFSYPFNQQQTMCTSPISRRLSIVHRFPHRDIDRRTQQQSEILEIFHIFNNPRLGKQVRGKMIEVRISYASDCVEIKSKNRTDPTHLKQLPFDFDHIAFLADSQTASYHRFIFHHQTIKSPR